MIVWFGASWPTTWATFVPASSYLLKLASKEHHQLVGEPTFKIIDIVSMRQRLRIFSLSLSLVGECNDMCHLGLEHVTP
jgi:hypothetical protein